MPEKTEGQQLVDIFVETAHVNAEISKGLRFAWEDEKKGTRHIEQVFDEHGLSAAEALDLVHGTDQSTLMRLERLDYLRDAGRPSLLNVAQRAFHLSARERVTELVDGRPITVTSLSPKSKDTVIQAPAINVNLSDVPEGVTGHITDYYSQIDRVILSTDKPIIRTAKPRLEAEPESSSVIEVAPVKRSSKFTTQYIPQVAIDIQTPDQAA